MDISGEKSESQNLHDYNNFFIRKERVRVNIKTSMLQILCTKFVKHN